MPPFSGKKKKAQLQAKREKKRAQGSHLQRQIAEDGGGGVGGGPTMAPPARPSGVPTALLTTSLGKSSLHNRMSTVFAREDSSVVRARRALASARLATALRGAPLRAWSRAAEDPALRMPRGLLSALATGSGREAYVEAGARGAEEARFKAWLDAIYARYAREELNMFEHNLEVWMQLWHTLATAHVVCIVADARNPLWHVPPSLYEHVVDELRKPLVLVLNKADLVPPEALAAWQRWLAARFPAAVVVTFSASGADLSDAHTLPARRRAIRGARTIFDAAHTGRRAAGARALLAAAGAPPAAVEEVAARVEATLKVGTKRVDAVLSVDGATGSQRSSFSRGEGGEDEKAQGEAGWSGADDEEEVKEEEEEKEEEEDSENEGAGGDGGGEGGKPGAEGAAEMSGSGGGSSSDDDAEWGAFGRRAPPPVPAAAARGTGAGLPPRAPAPARGRRGSNNSSGSSSADGFDPTKARPRHYKRGDAAREVAAMQRSFASSSGGGSAEVSGSELGGAGGGGGGTQRPRGAAPAAAATAGHIIAMVGHPNVGKSSVINALCGEKRVSVSRTAGHTKRAQTIPLAVGVALLDCPGLVFPHALVPPPEERVSGREFAATSGSGGGGGRGEAAASSAAAAGAGGGRRSTPALTLSGTDAEERAKQECCGVVPLAQVREPFTAVRFLGEHLEVERLYGLAPPRDEVEDMMEAAGGVGEGASRGAAMSEAAACYVWSPLSLCEQLAEKRGYYIAKTGRLDAHAAGREILYDSQDGVLPLWWLPPE
jgi:ribosome biogenesis GTPase A